MKRVPDTSYQVLRGGAGGLADFRRQLLQWYADHGRQLNFRKDADPYRVWVAETMLQQTQVAQMTGYFERFLAAFPTVSHLAAAAESQVLRVWSGLGYYARARHLHQAARQIVDRHGGRIPDTREQLLTLPGVGPSTSAAVASIAFGRDHAVVDGNVVRVLCRVLLIRADPRRGSTRRELVSAAELLLCRGRAGDFNQAMMELGARICTPRNPSCHSCPVATHCRALAETEDPAQLPRRGAPRRRPHYEVAAGVIWRHGRLLIAQRPRQGMLGGLWEFPGGKQEPGETLPECLVREIAEELDFRIAVERHLLSLDHAYTHFTITLHAFQARWVAGQPRAVECADWRWVTLDDLDGFAFPRTDARIIAHLRERAAHQGLWQRG